VDIVVDLNATLACRENTVIIDAHMIAQGDAATIIQSYLVGYPDVLADGGES
jgi:hypothetical protein